MVETSAKLQEERKTLGEEPGKVVCRTIHLFSNKYSPSASLKGFAASFFVEDILYTTDYDDYKTLAVTQTFVFVILRSLCYKNYYKLNNYA